MSSFSLLHFSFFNKTSIDGLILTLRKNNILASSLKIVANLNDGRRAALRVKITKHHKMKVMQSSIDCRKKCAISLFLHNFALLLVQKTNQRLNKNQSRLAHSCFRVLETVCVFLFEFSLATRNIFLSSDWSL